MICFCSILTYPNDQDKFILDTDASDKAMGAVLSQVQVEVERVVAYGSKTFSQSEKNCVTRKELLAVVYFVKHFKYYLLGKQFLIRTDHGSLRWLMNFRNPEGQIARWLGILSSFDFEIQHRPGKMQMHSRIPCRQCDRSADVGLLRIKAKEITNGRPTDQEKN